MVKYNQDYYLRQLMGRKELLTPIESMPELNEKAIMGISNTRYDNPIEVAAQLLFTSEQVLLRTPNFGAATLELIKTSLRENCGAQIGLLEGYIDAPTRAGWMNYIPTTQEVTDLLQLDTPLVSAEFKVPADRAKALEELGIDIGDLSEDFAERAQPVIDRVIAQAFVAKLGQEGGPD